jgi:adenylate kinase
MLNIVLFGPPGAGKGTQSEKLISKYNLVHLSTGDILRGEIAAGTELGMKAKKLMDEGVLVPDDVVIGMISSKLDQNKDAKGFIFDGFPRTTAQAEALDRLLKEKNTEITMMLALEVDNEELTKRLLLRGQDSGRPDDQNEEIIRNRVNEYNNKTAPLKEYYTAQNKFYSVYGIGSVEEIFDNLTKAISAKQDAAEVKDDRGILSKVVDVVKAVFSSPEKKDRPAVKKVAKKTAKAPAKKTVKKTAKKVSKKTAVKKDRPAQKKAVKKTPAKKNTVKKSTAKKAVKKTAKKIVKKTVKKAAKKTAPKKVGAKKATPKKVQKKVAAKKTVKKAAKKTVKKQSRKSTAKKLAKKQVKKVVKKNTAKKTVKKVTAKKTGSSKKMKTGKRRK